MKVHEYKQLKIVQAGTYEEFEILLNEAMRDLAANDPEFEIKGDKIAFITYTLRETIPVTISDEFSLKGIHLHCEDCPHLVRIPDKRRIWHLCDHTEHGRTRLDGSACETFLREIKEGKVKPIE